MFARRARWPVHNCARVQGWVGVSSDVGYPSLYPNEAVAKDCVAPAQVGADVPRGLNPVFVAIRATTFALVSGRHWGAQGGARFILERARLVVPGTAVRRRGIPFGW